LSSIGEGVRKRSPSIIRSMFDVIEFQIANQLISPLTKTGRQLNAQSKKQ